MADAHQTHRQGRLAWMAGLAAGLVYLTKGTGFLLVIIFLVTVVHRGVWRIMIYKL